jgi:hypothetical protein
MGFNHYPKLSSSHLLQEIAKVWRYLEINENS